MGVAGANEKLAVRKCNYRISSNSSRASNKRRASNTGRGSEPFVPIDAGLRINAGPRIQAGSQIEARYSCTQYCTASVLLVFVYPVLYSRYIVGIRVLSTVQPVYCWYLSTVQLVYCWYWCTQYCTAGVLLVFVYCTAGVRAIGVNRRRASNKRRASNTGRGSEPFVPIDAGGFYSRKYGTFLESCHRADVKL